MKGKVGGGDGKGRMGENTMLGFDLRTQKHKCKLKIQRVSKLHR